MSLLRHRLFPWEPFSQSQQRHPHLRPYFLSGVPWKGGPIWLAPHGIPTPGTDPVLWPEELTNEAPAQKQASSGIDHRALFQAVAYIREG